MRTSKQGIYSWVVVMVIASCGHGSGSNSGSEDETPKACRSNADCTGACILGPGSSEGRCARACPETFVTTSDTVCGNACTTGEQCQPGWACLVTASSLDGSTQIHDTCACSAREPKCDGQDRDCDGVVDGPAITDAVCTAELGYPARCSVDSFGDGGCAWCPNYCASDETCTDLQIDHAHCGSCDQACGHDEVCSHDTCQAPAPNLAASNLASSSQYLVWAQGKLQACPASGCTTPQIIDTTVSHGPAIDGATVAWFNGNTLETCTLPSCTPAPLITLAAAGVDTTMTVADVDLHDGHVAWSAAPNTGFELKGYVATCALANCAATLEVVATDLRAADLVLTSGSLTWLEESLGTAADEFVRSCVVGACSHAATTTVEQTRYVTGLQRWGTASLAWLSNSAAGSSRHLLHSCTVPCSAVTVVDAGRTVYQFAVATDGRVAMFAEYPDHLLVDLDRGGFGATVVMTCAAPAPGAGLCSGGPNLAFGPDVSSDPALNNTLAIAHDQIYYFTSELRGVMPL